MRQLELKTTEINNSSDVGKVTYDDLVKSVVNYSAARDERFPVEEMRHRTRILNALAKANDAVLLLEDADADKLKSCVKEMRWPAIHDDLLEFTDDVLAMKECENGTEDNHKE